MICASSRRTRPRSGSSARPTRRWGRISGRPGSTPDMSGMSGGAGAALSQKGSRLSESKGAQPMSDGLPPLPADDEPFDLEREPLDRPPLVAHDWGGDGTDLSRPVRAHMLAALRPN